MALLLEEDDGLVLLSRVVGLRNRKGGRGQARFGKFKSDDPEARFKGERERYAMTEDDFRLQLQNLMRSYNDGEIGLPGFYQTFSKEIYRFYVRMYLLGRRSIGREDSRLSEEEARMLHGLHSREMKFFSGFVRDILKGGGRMPYPQRLDLYALSGYRVYLRGALYALPFADKMRFPWVVNPEAESCEDCLWKEAESKRRGGFTLEELEKEIGFPGEPSRHCQESGCESCLRRCRCHFELPGGIKQLPRYRPTSFKEVERIKTYAIAKKRIGAPALRPEPKTGAALRAERRARKEKRAPAAARASDGRRGGDGA